VNIISKNRAIITELHAKAKRVGCKFRNKDLQRIRYAGAKGLNDMFKLNYCSSVSLDDNGELVFGDGAIADLIPRGITLLEKVIKSPEAYAYHQPVILGLEHGVSYKKD
jgi:hypothetical protein